MENRDRPVNERGKGSMANGILLAEDSRDDAFLIQQAFNELGSGNELSVVCDGREVINYLNGAGPYFDRCKFKLPDVLLLDLNLPFINGFGVLTWIKAQPHLKDLPVVILTDWNFVEDINKACDLGAHSFFIKTPDFEDAVQHCLSLQRYRQDVKAGKDAEKPARVWPRKDALSPFPLGLNKNSCLPCLA
jgi:two-component system, response regulator